MHEYKQSSSLPLFYLSYKSLKFHCDKNYIIKLKQNHKEFKNMQAYERLARSAAWLRSISINFSLI